MSALTPSLAAEIVAASQAGCAQAAAALTKALDGPIQLGAVEAGQYASHHAEDALGGPGLLVVLSTGDTGLAIALPESSGLLPAWVAAPDDAGRTKLSELAKELAGSLIPSSLAIASFHAERVASLGDALRSGGATADAAAVTIEVTAAKATSHLLVVWPLTAPHNALAGVAASGRKSSTASRSLAQLPGFSRSLLKVSIPVSVHLASKRESVEEIVEIVPGSIIKFDKGCDELLHMVVGGQAIAEGEAVKVGDKFGFRVTAMLRPREHFVKVKRARAG